MAENTEKLVTLSNLSDHIEEIKRILKQVRAYIDKQDSAKVDKVSGKGLSTNDLTTELLNKLNSLENYDDTAVRNLIKGISSRIDTLVGESASEAIDNFNEILAFLNGVTDTQTLQGLISNLKKTLENQIATKANKSHTHTSSDITDFAAQVKTLQAADILSAEPTETTLTHTVNGTIIDYKIGELVRVPDSESETGYKFYQLHAITDGKATWATLGTGSGGNIDLTETVTISLASNQSSSDSSLVGTSVLVEDITNGTETLLSTTWQGSPITIKITAATLYRVTFGAVEGYQTPDAVQYTAQLSSTRSITAYYTLLPISTITVNQTISDPASMISGEINGEAIRAIRANSHRFLGKYTSSGTMTICQLSDTDSTKFADGSAADLTGAQGDVFMRLPEFYTKATETSTDVWQIQFAFGGQPDSTWKKWGGNDLIGVYEAYHSSSKIYSRSGVTPPVSISQADFKTYARNRGTGFTLVKHKHQNIMAFLFYALYGNTNVQAICGSGTDTYPKTSGYTNSLGMTDTTPTNGNSMSINFWGLENWWGDLYEWEDNVVVNSNIWNITEEDGTTRQVTGFKDNEGWYYPQKLVIGDNLDTIMKPGSSSGSTSVGYCDGNYLALTNSRVVIRSGRSSDARGGIICASTYGTSSNSGPDSGSRLAFTGNIVEEDNPETFKSLTAIG